MMTEADIQRITQLELDNAVERIRAVGPNRVVINSAGVAIPTKDALEADIVPDVVFIRGDGWTLGAPFQFERAAEPIWRDTWMAKYYVGTGAIELLNKEVLWPNA